MNPILADLRTLALYPLEQLEVTEQGRLAPAAKRSFGLSHRVIHHYNQIRDYLYASDDPQPLWVVVHQSSSEYLGYSAKKIMKPPLRDSLPVLKAHQAGMIAFPGGELRVDLDVLKKYTPVINDFAKINEFDPENSITLAAPLIPGLPFKAKHFKAFLRSATEGRGPRFTHNSDWIALYILGEQYGNMRVKSVAKKHLPLSPNWREMPESMLYAPGLVKELMLAALERNASSKKWRDEAFRHGVRKSRGALHKREKLTKLDLQRRELFFRVYFENLSQSHPGIQDIDGLTMLPLKGVTVLDLNWKRIKGRTLRQIFKRAINLKKVMMHIQKESDLRILPDQLTSLELKYYCNLTKKSAQFLAPLNRLEELRLELGWESGFGSLAGLIASKPEFKRLGLCFEHSRKYKSLKEIIDVLPDNLEEVSFSLHKSQKIEDELLELKQRRPNLEITVHYGLFLDTL